MRKKSDTIPASKTLYISQKEAYDELAKTASLPIPLTEEWEAYDLEFIPAAGRPADADDKHLPEHVRRSLVSGKKEKGQGPPYGSIRPTLCFGIRRR